MARCPGMRLGGCDKTYTWPRAKSRILKHAAVCPKLDRVLKQGISAEMGKDSPSAKLAKLRRDMGLEVGDDSQEETGDEGGGDGCTASESERSDSSRPIKKARTDLSSSTYTSITPTSTPSTAQPSSSSARPPAVSTSGSSQPKFSPSASQPSVLALSRKAKAQELALQLDVDILKFVCVSGMPPKRVDLQEWKTIFLHAAPTYTPVSSTTMEDTQLPRECARVKTLQLRRLQKCENLSLTFDGITTRAQESIYTWHVTTEERETHLFEGNVASGDSHTAEHLWAVGKELMDEIGPWRFNSMCSDDTGSTHNTRVLGQEEFKWLLNMPDPPHGMNRLIGDITELPHFKPTIKIVRRTVKFFKKSTQGRAHLTKARVQFKVSRGLVSIGKTRFGTIYWSGESVHRCLLPIRSVVEIGVIEIPDVNSSFKPGTRKSKAFEHDLEQLLMVIGPIAKSIKCLESSHSTVADVYLFWLAIMASIESLIVEDKLDLPNPVIEHIRRLCNYRFDKMINQAPSDIFITGFFLVPRYRDAKILKQINPLAINPISLSLGKKRKDTDPSPNRDAPAQASAPRRPAPKVSQSSSADTYTRIGNALMGMLRAEYVYKKRPIAGISANDAVEQLKTSLRLYARGLYPFNRPFDDATTPMAWWKALSDHPDARILAHLAIRLFAMTPNSMADERTASEFTWLNSARRSRQHGSTIVRMAQLRQHYKNEKSRALKNKNIPTVRYRDLAELLGPMAHSIDSDSEDEDDLDSDDDDSDELDSGDDGSNLGDHAADATDADILSPLDLEAAGIDARDGTAFDVSQQARLSAPELLDMLSDAPVKSAGSSASAAPAASSVVAQVDDLDTVSWSFE
ncbi:hypothetical protein PLICRDRAFT_358654 [Plicaturopsis crispa FD-325 SS-3]|uniref:DUF659 domain-containing protein n=1 Tax=Plicaturopsis crispa FD-325 SS-3 TaxID=944288 RepID=A0A0C9SXC4_PLICR|nr:hypothetical protein PLICRDRAFT_358654 [Plicaturopsis crispa FD-325 SS-3]